MGMVGSIMAKDEVNDKKISFAIVFSYCLLITNYTFKQVFNILNPSTRALVSAGFMAVGGVVFILNFVKVFKRINKLFLLTYWISSFIIIFNFLIFSKNSEYILNISFYLFLICLPTFLYYISIKDKSIFLRMFVNSGYYQIVLAIIFFVSVDLNMIKYDMVYSYLVLVPAIIFTYKIFNDFKVFYILLIGFCLFAITVVGSRGPLLAFASYCVIISINGLIGRKNKLKRQNIWFLLSILAIALIMVLFYKEVLFGINYGFSIVGINSRTITILINNDIDFSSGRTIIYEFIIEKIFQQPFWGYGIAGDRVLLDGTYPHNIFLEIFVQFGLLIGGGIVVVLIYHWILAIFKNTNKVEKDLIFMFFSLGLVQLFFTGSYLTTRDFWLFMAICLNTLYYKKKTVRDESNLFVIGS